MRDHFSSPRIRQDRDLALARRGEWPGPGSSAAFVGRVAADPALPTVAGRYVAVHPVTVAGVEAEGSPADLVADRSVRIFVLAIGTRAPAVGDDLICRFVENRWVAERTGRATRTGVATLPGCACTEIPTSLHMSASGPCGEETFPTCDFQFGPTPPELTGLDLGPNCFLSLQTFDDQYSGTSYKLHLGCDSVFVRLSRVYLPSSQGGASHDATLYAWSIGQPGNTCRPFLLSVGFIYPGGNPRCVVTVTE